MTVSPTQERFRVPLLGAKLLTVFARYEKVGEVHHVVAEFIRDDTLLLGGLTTRAGIFDESKIQAWRPKARPALCGP